MIKWAKIEAECGGYREGFVAIFRKYEGQKTDERDAQGRIVKVTVTSFARHVGVPVPTFRRWVKMIKRNMPPEARASMDASIARRMLRDAPLEHVEHVIESLPPERQEQIAAAAGHGYLKARQQQQQSEQRRTPDEQREVEQTREQIGGPARRAVAAFSSLGIVAHVEQATEELRELTADASLTPESVRSIMRAVDELVAALDFAQQLVEGGVES